MKAFAVPIAVSLAASVALAQEMIEVRVGLDEGAIYDAIIDGFPGIAELDGVPDLPGNQLAVGLKAGVSEERGVAEFPLDSGLPGLPLAEATLTFNIDDILSTFGPGTDFRGEAATSIFVHVYAGDGTVEVGDFLEVDALPVEVDTTIFGVITDATLQDSGPILFEVDITPDVAGVLETRASHLGVVWRVEDSPTGTSLDDLGSGSLGPPGIDGAELPFVTLRFEMAPPTPTPTATLPPATATPTPQPAPACSGDCSLDSQVTVDEIVRLVGIALGNEHVAACNAGDTNTDGQVTVDEIVNAIGKALGGCAAG